MRLPLLSADFFENQLILSGIPSFSISLDPDQAQHFVGPDLGPNCLQRLSPEGTSRLHSRNMKLNVMPQILGVIIG